MCWINKIMVLKTHLFYLQKLRQYKYICNTWEARYIKLWGTYRKSLRVFRFPS